MTSIDSTTRLAALIRQQIDTSQQASTLREKQQSSLKRAAIEESPGQTAAGLRALIAMRVAAIDPDDPDRPRKAFRIFLEAVLLAELGQELANDPAFYGLVDEVQRQMESHPPLLAAIERASTALVGAVEPNPSTDQVKPVRKGK